MLKYQMFLRKGVQIQRIAGRTSLLVILGGVAVVGLSASPAVGDGRPPIAPDNGGGTVDLPVPDSHYQGEAHYHSEVAAGNRTAELDMEHGIFSNIIVTAGGTLLGQIETFDSELKISMTGAGDLVGFSRTMTIDNVLCVVHSAPRTPGDAVQSFDTTMYSLSGSLAPGDPDFATFTVTAGDALGMASPGHTTLTRLGNPGSDFEVDSYFDVNYRIDWVGEDGGAFDGAAGTETGTVRVWAQQEVIPAVSEWGVVALALLVLAAGTVVIRRARHLAAQA